MESITGKLKSMRLGAGVSMSVDDRRHRIPAPDRRGARAAALVNVVVPLDKLQRQLPGGVPVDLVDRHPDFVGEQTRELSHAELASSSAANS